MRNIAQAQAQAQEKSASIELKIKIASRILVARTKRGWSQEVLAEVCGLHRNYIGHLERREFMVGLENLQKIATALDMTLPEFFNFNVLEGL